MKFNSLIQVGGRLLDLSIPQVMGILNATPDSFFAVSRAQTEEAVCKRIEQILSEGGTMVDIGACSTRPGGALATEAEERERLQMALGVVRKEFPDVVISVDTFRPNVAKMAVEGFGVEIINDISGGDDYADVINSDDIPSMFSMVSRLRVPYILMSSMNNIHDMIMEFTRKVQVLRSLGQKDIIIDPGFGFGKTLDENYHILNELNKLQILGLPILVGVSRKRMIHQLLNITPDEALNGTTVANTLALSKGASILRVHDVKEAVEAVRIIHNL